jgi:hypothetical protein
MYAGGPESEALPRAVTFATFAVSWTQNLFSQTEDSRENAKVEKLTRLSSKQPALWYDLRETKKTHQNA